MTKILSNHLVELLRTPTGTKPPTKWELQAADRIEALERTARIDASLAKQLSRSMALNAKLQARIQALETALLEAKARA